MRNKKQTDFKNAAQRKRNGGYALVGLLSMMPVLLTIFFATASFALLAREHTRSQTLCKNHLFNMQDNISNLLNKLINLNPKARNLRIQNQSAQRQLQLAVLSANAIKIALAEARLIQIKLARILLDTEQKNLIAEANSLLQTSAIKLRHNLRQRLVHLKLNPLAVHPDVLGDVAPIYETRSDFRQAQKASAFYTWNIPHWLKNQQTHFRFGCSVSIEKRALLYRATLMGET